MILRHSPKPSLARVATHFWRTSCGILAQPGNPGAHAAAVREWISNPTALEAARQNCREHALTHLDWQHIAADLWRNLRHLAQGRDEAAAPSALTASQPVCAGTV